MITVQPIAEDSLILYFGDKIHLPITQTIMQLVEQLTSRGRPDTFPNKIKDNILEITPSYTSLFIQYRASQCHFDEFNAALQRWIKEHSTSTITDASTTHQLPVYYHPDVGPDLPDVALRHKLSREDVIQRHQQTEYHVYTIGFAPGFAFLGHVSPHIATPRHDTPRHNIPAGSVGIANHQTAIYPNASPGGWQIIGNCPIPLFDINAIPMTPFNVGDKVKFNPVSRDKFLQLGGHVCNNWK